MFIISWWTSADPELLILNKCLQLQMVYEEKEYIKTAGSFVRPTSVNFTLQIIIGTFLCDRALSE